MGKRILSALVCYCLMAAGASAVSSESRPVSPPAIRSLLKPSVFKKVVQEREAMVHASLDDDPPLKPPTQRYSFYATMQVRASAEKTRAILTDYSLYAKMIPYVEKAMYSPDTKTLRIEGGIWMFKLSSKIRFEERGPSWIHFRIVEGHFSGLEGDVYFEPESGRGYPSTLVYMQGSQSGTRWPPRFVIERGAEIVFGFTARRMRDYIETQKNSAVQPRTEGAVPSHGSEIPQPRAHL